MGHKLERPVEPFSDLHVEHGHVRATLLHDPTVEGLDMAIYMDGSASMSGDYAYKKKYDNIIDWFFGRNEKNMPNNVEPQVQWMLEYLATKDRNGLLRVAYWACGGTGKEIELVGELKRSGRPELQVSRTVFSGQVHQPGSCPQRLYPVSAQADAAGLPPRLRSLCHRR